MTTVVMCAALAMTLGLWCVVLAVIGRASVPPLERVPLRHWNGHDLIGNIRLGCREMSLRSPSAQERQPAMKLTHADRRLLGR